jgi:hypothetical protein
MRTCSIHFSFRKGYANLVVSVWQLSLEHPLEMGGRRRRRRSELMHGEEDKWAHAWGHDVHGELSLEKIWNKCHRAWHILISSSSHFHILRTNHSRHIYIYIYFIYSLEIHYSLKPALCEYIHYRVSLFTRLQLRFN